MTAPAASLRIGFANMNWGTGQGADQHIVDDLIGAGCLFLGLVEAKVDDVAHMVPSGWHTAQSLANAARQGSAAAWGAQVKAVRHPPLRVGVLPGSAKMLARYLRIVDVEIGGKTVRVIVCHRPPARFRRLWTDFDASVRKHLAATPAGRAGRWLVLADFNMPIAKAAKVYGGTEHGTGIVGIVAGPGVHASSPTIDRRIVARRETDHPGVTVDVSLR